MLVGAESLEPSRIRNVWHREGPLTWGFQFCLCLSFLTFGKRIFLRLRSRKDLDAPVTN